MSDINIEKIDPEELSPDDNLLQSCFWSELKSSFGWKACAFRITAQESVSTLLVLVRELGAGNSLAYVPHGPASNFTELGDSWRYAAEIASALKPYLPSSCMFLRFDPDWGISSPAVSDEPLPYPAAELSPSDEGFRKATMDIQPPSTVMLDISKSEEELLKGMKSKTRYNIRLSARKGVEVRTGNAEALGRWYELYRITAERDRIALHSFDYYQRIFSLAEERNRDNPGSAPELRLLEAVIDGNTEAGIIICFQGPEGRRRATYLYGASSNNKRNCMPAYALQWEAVKQASAAGCGSYDFFGIPPTDDPAHPMHGLYRFKTGFGGEILHRPGCWDYPLKPVRYGAFRTAERLRAYYYKTIKKRLHR